MQQTLHYNASVPGPLWVWESGSETSHYTACLMPLFLQATTVRFTLTEGDRVLSIGELSGVVLSDADRQPEVASLQITLEGAQANGDEFVFVNATPVTGMAGFESGSDVSLNQVASLQEYQVSRRNMTGLISMP